jgi:glycosyltransferase involved in cell wall biosynthesis
MDTRHDPVLKALLRRGWRAAQLLRVLAATPLSGRGGAARVYYGGARAGDHGGPLVKVKRLQEYFPERAWDFNLVYALSNAPYLPDIGLAWLKRRGVPLVLNQNGVFYSGWYAGDWRAMNRTMAHAYHRADHVFWQSAFCRRAADRFLGPRDGAGEVLFNAIDTHRFCPAEARGERPFTFLLTGKIDAHLVHRLHSTLAGLAQARAQGLEARLVIAGLVAPAARQQADALVAELGLGGAVVFQGPYTQESAPAVYRQADAYVMTKYLDPCPNTVLEAMACGLPVLHSASGGVPELVGDAAGVGLEVPEDWEHIHVPDAAAIGAGMVAVADNARAMGAAARARAVAQFDIRDWIARHRAVFAALLEKTP